MQNYVYDRNYNKNYVRYKRMNGYRSVVKQPSLSRTFRRGGRVVAAILLLLLQTLVSDAAMTFYKGVLGCAVAVAFIGVAGGVETGNLSLEFGVIFAFIAIGALICRLMGKEIDI